MPSRKTKLKPHKHARRSRKEALSTLKLLNRLNPLHFRRHIRIWVFLVLFCAQDFLASFANDSFYSLSPYYRETYNMSALQISILSSLFSMPNTFLPYLFGIMVDKWGGSKLYIASTAFIIIAMAVAGLSGLPSSATAAFALVFLSRVVLSLGGQSIYTSHDVLHVKVFGPLVSLTLSLGISFGKIGSTSVFLLNSAVAGKYGLGTATVLTGVISMPISAIVILIVALHASDTRKKKRCMKTTGQVSVVITAGSIPVRVEEYAVEEEDDDYLYLSSYPQTPAEYRSDVEMGDMPVDLPRVTNNSADAPIIMEPTMTTDTSNPTGLTAPFDTDVVTDEESNAAEYIFTETMESRLEVATRGDGTGVVEQEPLGQDEGSFMNEYARPLGDASFETVPIEPVSPGGKGEAAQRSPGRGLDESDSESDSGISSDDAMPFGLSLMTALMEQIVGSGDGSDSEAEDKVAIALKTKFTSSPFASPFFWVQVMEATVVYILFYTFPSVAAVIFMGRNGITSEEASTATSFCYGGMVITPFWVIFTTKIGHRVTLTFASCALACTVFLLLIFTTFSPPLMALLIGIGASVLGSAVYSAFTLTVKTSAMGKSFGVLNSFINAGYFVSMFGLSMVASSNWRLCLMIYVGMSIISLALAAILFMMDLQNGARLALPQKRAVARKLEMENR
ncbi:Major facilitator superfamily [Carpediemonas membranifera]|uniref:Lysosomal dipeptide transporter MFSD1 n=1 Tax=Carpediemonas membranifera TaxID=201153 RepID=A0A8J6B6F9_9EUKA|nr:Major facilitator superfamily [Carpediemonas membranifera]|eukprot:KAG9394064.1 Major facilitator superfamily [Carpediemonas membranifera]